MKLKKLIKKLDGYCYIRVCLVEDWKKEEALDISQIVYSGYADDLPVCWIDYKVKTIVPFFRESPNKSDLEAGVVVVIGQEKKF